MRYVCAARLRPATPVDQGQRARSLEECARRRDLYALYQGDPGHPALQLLWGYEQTPVVAVVEADNGYVHAFHESFGAIDLQILGHTLSDSTETYDALRRRGESSAVACGAANDTEDYFFSRGQLWVAARDEPEIDVLVAAEAIEKERRDEWRLQRARAIVASENDPAQRRDVPSQRRRDVIPDDVKVFVWKRDGGRCVRCDSDAMLEFDHVIPVALGGSNTARNIQLLCEGCNRAKGASLV